MISNPGSSLNFITEVSISMLARLDMVVNKLSLSHIQHTRVMRRNLVR